MVLKMSEGQCMSLLSEGTKKDSVYDHYLQHSHVQLYETTGVSFEKEQLISHRKGFKFIPSLDINQIKQQINQ